MHKQLLRILLGTAAVMLFATQALAVPPAAPASLTLPPSPDADGTYKMTWGASPTAGSGYVLEEDDNAGFASPTAVYSGSNKYVFRYTLTPATYYYRVRAVNAAAETSAWVNGASGVVVAAAATAAAPPTSVTVPATDADGTFKIFFSGSTTAGPTYVVQQSIIGDFSDAVQVAAVTTTYAWINNRPAGTYHYRVGTTKTGLTPSGFLAAGNPVVVGAQVLTAPGAITTPSPSTTGSYKIIWGASSSGGTYVLEEDDNAGFTSPTTLYTGTGLYKTLSGKAEGTYHYRVKTTKAGLTDSPYASASVVVQLVAGSTYCVNCHNPAGAAIVNKTQGPAWQASRHANSDTTPPAGVCTQCHNELMTSSSDIGCEGCHGVNGTAGHPGADLTSAIASCAGCHNSHGSASATIAARVAASKHNIGATDHTDSCGRCHSIEGYLAFEAGTENYGAVSVALYPGVNNVSCTACHDSHSGNLRVPRDWAIGSAQFNLCTSCHNLVDAAGTPIASGLTVSGTATVAKQQHAKDWYRNITSTHFDLSTTGVTGALDAVNGTNVIEGYVVRKDSATACTDCHGHELYTNTGGVSGAIPTAGTIHTDWASSAHAGGLLSAKKTLFAAQAYTRNTTNAAAIMAVGATDAEVGNGWAHYNWDRSGRASCQRCHTATGASNFLNNPTGYVAANNDFSHLAGWTLATAANGSNQNEVLYCWGCHASVETGELRNPGAITEIYLGTGTGAPNATVSYPDVAASNVCMACHLGQKIGQNIADSTGDFTNLSFINSHYLTAGSTVFNQSGYEYAGQSYNGLGFHKNVGMANAYGSGSNGPCVGCHMNSGNAHSFEVVSKDAGGVITAVTSNACSKCHGGLTASALQTSSEEFATALAALKSALESKGIYFSTVYPYFYQADLITAFKNWDAVYPGKGKDVMGAAFNYNLFEHDPGAYAHNRQYALKLIADSCDFLADGLIDGLGIPATVTSTINSSAFTTATSWAATTHPSETNCSTCHQGVNSAFLSSQHKTREGKKTFYNDHLNDPLATEIQKGFGNYVTVAYTALPCAGCHNGNDNGPWDTNPALGTNVQSYPGPNCLDCHTNRPNGVTAPAFAVNAAPATTASAPVVKQTCYGCHSRQVNEGTAGLTDVHITAGMGCAGCHSTSDMHGTGTASTSQLEHGTITAQCENCHGDGKAQGPLSTIGEHLQHQGDIACSTCHAESMITCHNCHFDNEFGAPGTTKAKFFSGKFGGTKASGNSWRFLVNRKMADGSYKVYPGSMQSLVADFTDSNSPGDDGQVHTHAGIAPYYSHAITKINALRCSDCHGSQNAIDIYEGRPVRVTTWTAADGVAVPAASVQATFIGPKGVIPVPENPTGKLLMDFVDLTGVAPLSSASPRIIVQRDGPETIHMPEAYVKPLTALQIQKLAAVQFDHASTVATTSTPSTGFTDNTCKGCHAPTNTLFANSLHYSRQGKETFYNNNLNNPAAEPLQKGFGNYVTVGYTALPCADCHNAAAWKVDGVDTWAAETGGNPVCTDCHTNKVNGVATTTFDAPVAKATCIGCHSRQATETAMGLTDVHTGALLSGGGTLSFTCPTCHSTSDMHGDGTAKASQLVDGAVSAKCENCHTSFINTVPEHTTHLANIACSTCHMESVITCFGCHFDNEASDPADPTILHAKFASGKFGGTAASGKAWRFLVNRVMGDGSTKVYPASMQSLVADRTASNAPGEDNQGWTHAAIAPYYSHSITKVNALKCDKCHGIQNAIDLNGGLPVRVVKWNAGAGVTVPVANMMATYTAPSGVIPVPENPAGKLLMDFVDLVNPAAGPLNASGTSPSDRVLFQADGPDTIHMPEAYVKPLTAAQISALASPQVRP